ncbi:MAG: NAD-dependent epimerase/dehydratase family protein [Burkholderiales bacterium]|nr:NAD-dependent epimerase/dehydratase family protein [Burkholderiales bacterium]
MRILVTGVAGFVGSSISRSLLACDASIQIVGIDNLSYGYMERISDIKDNFQFIKLEVKDLPLRADLGRFDLIIHCAAIAPLPDNQANLYRSLEQNVALCGAVGDFCLKTGSENIIFFSSGAVYEMQKSGFSSEQSEVCPKLMYPMSKFLAENFFASFSEVYGIKTVALRLFNLYGPQQDYFRKHPPLIGYLIKSALTNAPITIYASEKARRDYIYIDDLVNMIQLIYSKLPVIEKGKFILVNVGSGVTYSVTNIISILEDVMGTKINYHRGIAATFWDKYPELFNSVIPLPLNYVANEVEKNTAADITMAAEKFLWQPQVNLQDGLFNCVEFARRVFNQ